MTITKPEFLEMYRSKLQELQEHCKEEPQVDLPVLHDFAPGVYARRILMPAGTFVIGKTHKTEHLNIIMSGSANVMIDGQIKVIRAPYIFKSGKGVKKVLYILEDMIWATIHPTEETDLDKLETECVFTDEEEKFLTSTEDSYGLQEEQTEERKERETEKIEGVV